VVHTRDVPANGPTAISELATPGDRIKFLRQSKDMTQVSLARTVYTTQPTVARWESNEFVPNRQAQALLADALGCSRDFLFPMEQAA
jgi:DNA-binding transcriptional regulator YiaG